MKLRLCGHGNKADVDRFIRKNHLNLCSHDIEFVGYQSAQQIAGLFKDSFCLIHPSYMDNSPNSVCEAQVSGLPVIATDVGGVGSLITDNETGMLVKRYDAAGLADKVCRLAEDKSLYRCISEKSRSLARERHNRRKIVDNTIEIYHQLAKSA
jgi:glycosyltransferase involved in cell wall biosynthesis